MRTSTKVLAWRRGDVNAVLRAYGSVFVLLSSCCYRCVTYCYVCVLILLYMCPHTAIYVSSCCYRCVLMLLYMCQVSLERSRSCMLVARFRAQFTCFTSTKVQILTPLRSRFGPLALLHARRALPTSSLRPHTL
jgi:hypothetical protein